MITDDNKLVLENPPIIIESENDNLERAYVLKLKIEGDDFKSVTSILLSVLIELDKREDVNGYNSVSGGYHGSHILEIKVNRDMTHNKYLEILNKKLGID